MRDWSSTFRVSGGTASAPVFILLSTAAILIALSILPACCTTKPAATPAAAHDTPPAAVAGNAQTDTTQYAARMRELMARAQAAEAPDETSASAHPPAPPVAAASVPPPSPRVSIKWIDPPPPAPVAPPSPPSAGEPAAASAPEPATPPIEQIDRQRLLDELRTRLRSGNEPTLQRAIAAVGLSLADPNRTLGDQELEGLDDSQKALVQRYHQVVVALARQLAGQEAGVSRESVEALLAGLLPPQPIAIRTARLCRRVRSFGVYEPFENDTFLAGQTQRMIVYLEVDHFKSVATNSTAGDAVFQVQLEQEIRLYNQSDGLEVWRQPPVRIVDESRNQRRDFFVVQMIELPARLTVGKYHLKVRLTDMHADCVDETSIPIAVIADAVAIARP